MLNLKRVAIVVGEHSGDILGAGLICALQKRFPHCKFEGIGGELMKAQGFHSHFALERLAVMGLIDPLKRLPELLSIRKQLKKLFKENPPDIFVGIDSPDFNLNLERYMREVISVPSVHYVSPSVWAWRKGRIKTIAKSVDLMLTLFPFEAAFYQENAVRNCFVGHPLADELSMEPDVLSARQTLGLEGNSAPLVGILPGSRRGEVEQLCERFLLAAQIVHNHDEKCVFLIPAASTDRKIQIEEILARHKHLPVKVFLGQSHEVMAASDAIIIASGTATLEALLLKKPMVIAYHMAAFSHFILSKLVKTPFIGLPNILAQRGLVPELVQQHATPKKIAQALLAVLYDTKKRVDVVDSFYDIHRSLKRNASETAAAEIISLLEDRRNMSNV